MKNSLFLIVFLGISGIANATLTPGIIPVTKTGGSSPTVQDGSITDTGTASGPGNVGIGTTSPRAALEVNGKIQASDVIQSPSINADQVFNVKTYGALGNGIHNTDGTITTGTNTFTSATGTFTVADVGKVITISHAGTFTGTTTNTDGAITSGANAFTSASATFTTADVNKIIKVTGAGATGGLLTTTISAFVSSTAVTLAANAGTTVSGAASYTYGYPADLTTTISGYTSATSVTLTVNAATTVSGVDYEYGTEDSAAIQSAINAAGTNLGGTVFFPAGIYMIANSYTGTANAELTLPCVSQTVPAQQIKLQGAYKPMMYYGFLSPITPTNYTGSLLLFAKNGSAGNSNIGLQCSGGFGYNFSNIIVNVSNLSLRTVINPIQTVLNLNNASDATTDFLEIDVTSGYWNLAQETGASSYALKMPQIGNHVFADVDHTEIYGYYYGIKTGPHTRINNSGVYFSMNALDVGTDSTVSTNGHYAYVQYLESEDCVNVVNFTNAGGTKMGGITANVNLEVTGPDPWATVEMINDPSNYGDGNVYFSGYSVNSVTQSGGTGLSALLLANTYLQKTRGGPYSTFLLNTDSQLQIEELINHYNTISFNGVSTATNYIGLTGGKTADNNLFFNVPTGGKYQFGSNGTFKSYIDSNGNIGIGTVTPVNQLAVVGGGSFGSAANVGIAGPTNGIYVQGNVGIGSLTPGQLLDVQGTVRMSKLGTTLSIASGTNGCQGQATLSGGTATVSTTCTPSTAQGIFLQDATTGALTNVGTQTVGTITSGTSFVINSTNVLDASTVNWWILKSA